MKFRIPQFIDMEDKIIGPLTLKQFGYLVGAGGMAFIIWTLIPVPFLAVLVIIPVSGLFIALAFVKYNNRSFGEFLEKSTEKRRLRSSNHTTFWKQRIVRLFGTLREIRCR